MIGEINFEKERDNTDVKDNWTMQFRMCGLLHIINDIINAIKNIINLYGNECMITDGEKKC